MDVIKWDPSYSVGDRELDGDHKALIELINAVSAAAEKGISAYWVIAKLEDYAANHFRREEERMKSSGYAELEEHKIGHQKFIDWLERVKLTYESSDAETYIADGINDYLRKWLTDHILVADMKYKGKI